MPKVGDLVADKYEIIQLIGEGGMGSVFLASHNLTGKRVAIKWMLPELAQDQDAVQRFLREAQAAGRIAHPNVVDIYDVGEHLGSYFLVMEYLRGEPLTALIERGPLVPHQIVDILLPCLQGVAAAHRKGVVHRDLKPDNIFLCRSEDGVYLYPKVLDFGISKLASSESDINPRLTRTGAVMGTPYYMSPEQLRGSHHVDGRCDVYAFGVILYEALVGQVPFQAETYSALVVAIATGTPLMPRRINPGLSTSLEAVVMRAIARDPVDRYPSVRALGTALEPFAGSVRFTATEHLDPTGAHRHHRYATTSHSSTPFTTGDNVVPGFRRRSATLWIGSTLGGLAAVGMAAWWIHAQDPAAPGADPSAGDLPGPGNAIGAAAQQLPPDDPSVADSPDPVPEGRDPALVHAEGDPPTRRDSPDPAPRPPDHGDPPQGSGPATEPASLPVGDRSRHDPQAAVSAAEAQAAQEDPAEARERAGGRPPARHPRHARPPRRPREPAARRPPSPPEPAAPEARPEPEAPAGGQAPAARERKPRKRGRTGSLSVDDF